MNKKTGGTAFPNVDCNGQGIADASSGMTLRDYIAAKAMQSLICNEKITCGDSSGGFDISQIALFAYSIADEMIEAGKLGAAYQISAGYGE